MSICLGYNYIICVQKLNQCLQKWNFLQKNSFHSFNMEKIGKNWRSFEKVPLKSKPPPNHQKIWPKTAKQYFRKSQLIWLFKPHWFSGGNTFSTPAGLWGPSPVLVGLRFYFFKKWQTIEPEESTIKNGVLWGNN